MITQHRFVDTNGNVTWVDHWLLNGFYKMDWQNATPSCEPILASAEQAEAWEHEYQMMLINESLAKAANEFLLKHGCLPQSPLRKKKRRS